MEIKSIYELAKDDLITWLPLKNIFFNEFHYSQNFGKLGLCGCLLYTSPSPRDS